MPQLADCVKCLRGLVQAVGALRCCEVIGICWGGFVDVSRLYRQNHIASCCCGGHQMIFKIEAICDRDIHGVVCNVDH